MRQQARTGTASGTRSTALLLAVVVGAVCAEDPSLEQLAGSLNIDQSQISLSGVSSGAYMAQQFHVVHSEHIVGVGLIAGGPYRCAAGTYPPYSWFDWTGLYAATSVCSDTNPLWVFQGPPDPAFSIRETRAQAQAGFTDDPLGLRGDRVWLLSGGEDGTVPRPVVESLEVYYRELVDGDDLHHEKLAGAGHAMITDDFGTACDESRSPFISDCDFDAAGHLLEHIYGPLRPAAGLVQPALAFDQSRFFDIEDPSVSMNTRGHLYVPRRCHAGERCRLHVAFHGCQQHQALIGDQFLTHAGYNEWAESNDIVVLYPQTTAWKARWVFGPQRNPKGCWDWWGYSGDAYHRRDGKQLRAVAAMINVLLGSEVLALE